MNQTLNTSITISLLKKLYRCYENRWQDISYLSRNSQSVRLLRKFCKTLKTVFRDSFFGRISEIKQTRTELLDNSRAVQNLINLFKEWKEKIIHDSKTSLAVTMGKDAKEGLYFFTVKMLSIIVVTAIVMNLFLSLFLPKQIGLVGWLLRGLFLFVGITGLFSNADWTTLKNSSLIFKLFNKRQLTT